MKKEALRRYISETVDRQKAFFASSRPGSLLYLTKKTPTKEETDLDSLESNQGLAGYVYRAVVSDNGNVVPTQDAVTVAVHEYVQQRRENMARASFPPPGDSIPCMYAHWDIGWHTAAIAGLQPSFSRGSWWLEPNLSWEEIENLEFNPDNPQLVTAKFTHRALWSCWEEDFWTMPFIHRSPLDYANGLRGTRLFMEMITDPNRVKRLLDWCVDWQLKTEEFVYEGLGVQAGWGTGIMNTWCPDRSVWVNGDPVGLISREMMAEFEQPYTGKLFASTGGGFFHNHTLGLFQVDRVAATQGILVQNFARDPNRPSVEQTLIEDPVARKRILDASLETPIHISAMTPEGLLSVLPIAREGRFLFDLSYEEGYDIDSLVRRVKNV